MEKVVKIAVRRTGHEIADTVADAIVAGLGRAHIDWTLEDIGERASAYISYGILRGNTELFHSCRKFNMPWCNVDKGYWKPGHYDGYYRISLRGTQQTHNLDKIEPDYDRWKALGIELKPWRGFDYTKPILLCPPTEAVEKFFLGMGVFYREVPLSSPLHTYPIVVRHKGDPSPLNFDDYNYVITFNSSVGWQAMAAGIPCVSDPIYSIVGARYSTNSLEELSDIQYMDRERLFAIMSRLQLTLNEMRAGKIWDVMSLLLSISDMTPENQSQVT